MIKKYSNAVRALIVFILNMNGSLRYSLAVDQPTNQVKQNLRRLPIHRDKKQKETPDN